MEFDPLPLTRFYATVKHGDHRYNGGLPYSHHLSDVEQVLRRFGPDGNVLPLYTNEMLMAAWLHDVLEDTDTKKKEIAELFDDKVADLVWRVTNEQGENRKVRHALTYPKIRDGGQLAIRLKLADRIANVEAGGKLVGMYKSEYEDFRPALYYPGTFNESMWQHLDKLLGG